MPDENSEVNHGLKLIAKSSLIVSITLLLSKIFLYLYRIIIARHYGPEVYGLFTLSVVIANWFRIFSSFGLKEGLLRYISLFRGKNEKDKIKYIYKKSVCILAITSILAGILLFCLSKFVAVKIFSNPDLIIFLRIFSISIPFIVLGPTFLSVIRAFEKINPFSFISNILGNLVQLVLLIILIFLGINSNSVSVSYLIGVFSICLASYLISRKIVSKISFTKNANNKENKKTFKEMFSYSWPFLFYGVINFIFYWTDSFMIGIFRNVEEVGFYNAAVPIALFLSLPFDLFAQLFFPLVTKEFSKGNLEIVKQLSQQVGKWIFMVIMPIFILFMIFPGAFINIFFGKEYLVATDALRFLAVGNMILTLCFVSRELISIKGKSKLILVDMLIAGVANIILNAILIPAYGITGAALATMISMIFLGVLFVVQSYKSLSIIPLRRKMLRITLVLVISTGLLLLVKSLIQINLFSLILCGIFFVLVYILLILLTNCLDKNDWYILKSFLNKFKKK